MIDKHVSTLIRKNLDIYDYLKSSLVFSTLEDKRLQKLHPSDAKCSFGFDVKYENEIAVKFDDVSRKKLKKVYTIAN